MLSYAAVRPIDNYPDLRDDLSHLTRWQRVRRWFALLGGAYRHPNGYVELDFDRRAGIRFSDTQQEAERKLDRYNARESRRELIVTCVFLSAGVMLLLHEFVLH